MELVALLLWGADYGEGACARGIGVLVGLTATVKDESGRLASGSQYLFFSGDTRAGKSLAGMTCQAWMDSGFRLRHV